MGYLEVVEGLGAGGLAVLADGVQGVHHLLLLLRRRRHLRHLLQPELFPFPTPSDSATAPMVGEI